MEAWIRFTMFLGFSSSIIAAMFAWVLFLMFCTRYPMKWTTTHVLRLPGVENLNSLLHIMKPGTQTDVSYEEESY